MAEDIFDLEFVALFSRYSRISGAKYSGVVAEIYVTLWNWKADPKSISFIAFISDSFEFISTSMLSGLMSE
jgi:hypothetical protein